jgi:hypothetical protein
MVWVPCNLLSTLQLAVYAWLLLAYRRAALPESRYLLSEIAAAGAPAAA